MEAQRYKRQVRLLLDILPEVAKEDCFALHGGTAINMFVRNMPRMSVDIDLTSIVPFGQLFGGKICAALDRQHPRDLFDLKYLLTQEGFSDIVKYGFIYCLLGSDRPIHEIIRPHFQDQRLALERQFSGMTAEKFTYEDYEQQRELLVQTIYASITQQDKTFLLSFKNAEPDWSIYNFERFPSIQWKLQNLNKLKKTNPGKHLEQYQLLEKKLGGN